MLSRKITIRLPEFLYRRLLTLSGGNISAYVRKILIAVLTD